MRFNCQQILERGMGPILIIQWKQIYLISTAYLSLRHEMVVLDVVGEETLF